MRAAASGSPSAAPGFDARLVGGTSVVERRGGATLRAELDAAATLVTGRASA